jgi:hypothetical protein
MKNKILTKVHENLAFISLLVFTISFLFPWINVDGIKMTGLKLLSVSINHLQNEFNFSLFLYVVLYLFIFIGLIVMLISVIIHCKKEKYLTLMTSILSFASSTIFLFLVKKMIDFMQIFQLLI